jgi:hypothetical protein
MIANPYTLIGYDIADIRTIINPYAIIGYDIPNIWMIINQRLAG